MSKNIFSNLADKLKNLRPPQRRGIFSLVFIPIIEFIFRIPRVKNTAQTMSKTGLSYLQTQINIYESTAPDKAAKIKSLKNWVNHQHLQIELDEAGDGEPIENYYADDEAEPYDDENYTSPHIVTSTLGQLSVKSRDEPLQKIIWSHLEKITIVVYEPNPIDPELWIALKTKDAVASFPDWADGSDKVLKRIFNLDGFNHELYLKATISEGYEEIIVYEKTT